MLEVHISKHSLFRLKITVGCLTSRYPSIHPFLLTKTFSSSRSVVDCARVQAFTFSSQDHGRLSALCWCWRLVVVLCVVWVLCSVEWGGVYVCVFCVVFLFFLSILFFLLLTLSLSFSLLSFISLLSSLLFSLPRFLFSSLHVTKHCGKNRSHNTAANFEACECDLAHGRCTAVGSLSSSPLPPSSSKKK